MPESAGTGEGVCPCPEREGTPTDGDRAGTSTPPDRPGTATPPEPPRTGSPPPDSGPDPPKDHQGKSGKAPCYCYCQCVKHTTTRFTGIYGDDAPGNLTFAVEDDLLPAPSTAFGIGPAAAVSQLWGPGPSFGLEQAGTSILRFPVQQVVPSFESTVMPGGVFAGPVMSFGEDREEEPAGLGGSGGREDVPGGLGNVAGVGIGPLPWMTKEVLTVSPPSRPPPFRIDDGRILVTASSVGRTFDNVTGTAAYAIPAEPPVAPDSIFLGYPRTQRMALRGLEVAPHAGYFYFGGMDSGPNGGIGSDGVPRLHDGYDQVRTPEPPVEPEAMCGHAMSTGELSAPPMRRLRLFEGEGRMLSLGRGAALAPDSIADTPGGAPPAFEAEAPLSPLRQEVATGSASDPGLQGLSKGAIAVMEGLLDAREAGARGAFPGAMPTRAATTEAGGGARQGQGFAGGKSGLGGSDVAVLAASASMAGIGGGGGGSVAKAANAWLDYEDARQTALDATASLDKAKAANARATDRYEQAKAEHKEALDQYTAAENAAAGNPGGSKEARDFEAEKSEFMEAQTKWEAEQAAKEEADKALTTEQARFDQAFEALDKAEGAALMADLDGEDEYSDKRDYNKQRDDAIERYRKDRTAAKDRLDNHDKKMGAGSGNTKAATAARTLGQNSRNTRDSAASASARLTQLRGHITPEQAKAIKDAVKGAKGAASVAKAAAKKARNAGRFGPPSRVKKTEQESKDAQAELDKANMALALALAIAEAAAAKKKQEQEEKKGKKKRAKQAKKRPHKYTGDWPDCDPEGCKCPPGNCKQDETCLWCMWIPYPPPGQKGKGVGAAPALAGLMPADTGMMGLCGFPYYALMQEGPKPPPKPGDDRKKPPGKGPESGPSTKAREECFKKVPCTILFVHDETEVEKALEDAGLKDALSPLSVQLAKDNIKSFDGGTVTEFAATLEGKPVRKAVPKNDRDRLGYRATITHKFTICITLCVIFIRIPKLSASPSAEEIAKQKKDMEETIQHEGGHVEIAQKKVDDANSDPKNTSVELTFTKESDAAKLTDAEIEEAVKRGGTSKGASINPDSEGVDTKANDSVRSIIDAKKKDNSEYDSWEYGKKLSNAKRDVRSTQDLEEQRRKYDAHVEQRNEDYKAMGLDLDRLPDKSELRGFKRP